jgi:hypothetical protein
MSNSPEQFAAQPNKAEQTDHTNNPDGSDREVWSLKSKQPMHGAAKEAHLNRMDRESEEAQRRYREQVDGTNAETTDVAKPEERIDSPAKSYASQEKQGVDKKEKLPEITQLARASREAQEAYDAKAQEYYASRGALQSFAGSARKLFGGDELPAEIVDLRERYKAKEELRREKIAEYIRKRGERTGAYEASRKQSDNAGIVDIIKKYDTRYQEFTQASKESGESKNERIDMKMVEAYQSINPALRRGMSYGALTGLAVAGGAPLVGAATVVGARMGLGALGGWGGAYLAGRINLKQIKNLSDSQKQELTEIKEGYQQSVEELSRMYNSQQSQISVQEARNMRRQIGFAALGGLVGGTAGGWAGNIDFSSVEQGQPTYTTPDTTVIEQERALGYTKYTPGDTVYDIAHQQVVDQSLEMGHLSMQERDNLVMNFIEKLRHDPELSVALTGSYSPDHIQAGDEIRLDSWKQLMSEESGSIKNRAFDWELDRADDGQGNFESMTAAADALDESTQAGAATQEVTQAAPEAVNPLAEYAVQPGDNLWNLWGEHAGAPLTDAQKVAMEEMVRANPAAFRVDSSHPDLIYAGEDINLQAMFDAAEQQGIIPASANPALEPLQQAPEITPQPAGEPAEAPPIETLENSNPETLLSGSPTQMATQMEEYLQDESRVMVFEDARPYFDSVLAEGNYDFIKQNILDNYGGEEVYVKAVGVNPETGNQVVDFTNNNDPNNGTFFRYDLESQQFIGQNIDKPGFFSRLFS